MKPTERRRKARIIETVLAVLVARYPKCFTLAEADRRPLKVGIGGDVIAHHPELKPSNIGQALAWYTRSRAYLERMVEGAERVDLGGVAAGTATAIEAADALVKLKARARVRKTPAEPAPVPRRLGLADLREAAQQREAVMGRRA